VQTKDLKCTPSNILVLEKSKRKYTKRDAMYIGDEQKNSPEYKTYKTWLLNSKPNERFVYFTGNSLSESIVGTFIGQVLMEDALKGMVYLFQRKLSPYNYEHIAIRASIDPHQKLIPERINYHKKFKGDKWSRKLELQLQ